MDNITKNQVGSPSRDAFKRRHKDLSKTLYACDLDFVLVEKNPIPDIIAAIDYKRSNDQITFSEVIAYNALVRRGIFVFIVSGEVETGVFEISRYKGGHHGKPTYHLESITNTRDWGEFESWEKNLRKHYARLFNA